jgi:hypothetical protein
MVLHRELAISLLDLVFGRVLGNAEDFVVVAFGLGSDQIVHKRKNAGIEASARSRHVISACLRMRGWSAAAHQPRFTSL